jgi:hypothetical protein
VYRYVEWEHKKQIQNIGGETPHVPLTMTHLGKLEVKNQNCLMSYVLCCCEVGSI